MVVKLLTFVLIVCILKQSQANDDVVGLRARFLHKEIFNLAEEAVQSDFFQNAMANSQGWFKDLTDESWEKDMSFGKNNLTVIFDEVVPTKVVISNASISVGNEPNTIAVGLVSSFDLDGKFTVKSKTISYGPKPFSLKNVTALTRHLIGFDTSKDLFALKLHKCDVTHGVDERVFKSDMDETFFTLTKPLGPYLENLFCFYDAALNRISGVMPDGGDLTWPDQMEILYNIMMDVGIMNGVSIDDTALSFELSLRTWPKLYPDMKVMEEVVEAPMLDETDVTNMVQGHLSRYPIGNFIETAYNTTDALKLVIPDDLASFSALLGESELDGIMEEIDLGLNTGLLGIVAGFAHEHKARPMKMQLQAVSVPQFFFVDAENAGSGKVILKGDFKLKFFVVEKNESLYDAITLSYGLNVEGNVHVSDTNIMVSDTNFGQTITLNEETNIEVATDLLIMVLEMYLEDLFFERAEDFLSTGIELPTFGDVLEFQNINLKLSKLFAALKGSIDINFGNIKV